ncbi:hypothetical protein V8E36_006307, partial [Tilletia maclaganii]
AVAAQTQPPSPVDRRRPVLNIGTYLRCTALDRVVHSFLRPSGQVSLSPVQNCAWSSAVVNCTLSAGPLCEG